MASHVSLRTALDKNKLASNDVYLLLLEIDVLDPLSGKVAETVYIVYDNDPAGYEFDGKTYMSMPLTVNLQQDSDTQPSCTLTVFDYAQVIQSRLQSYGATIGWPARFKIVNANADIVSVESEQQFFINGATANAGDFSIAFTVTAENPLTLSFPNREMFRNQCFWTFKDENCAYINGQYSSCGTTNPNDGSTKTADLDSSCDLSLDGVNGCRAHCNTLNYGGFPDMTTSATQTYVQY